MLVPSETSSFILQFYAIVVAVLLHICYGMPYSLAYLFGNCNQDFCNVIYAVNGLPYSSP